MNKELTPLQALEKVRMAKVYIGKNGTVAYTSFKNTKQYSVIENALKEYESRKVFLDNVDKNVIVFEPKQVWEEKQKRLKALEIIKNKHINCIDIITTKDYEEYIDEFNRFVKGNNPLNREEYEILKEVLTDDQRRN